jgi:hypothetical protein
MIRGSTGAFSGFIGIVIVASLAAAAVALLLYPASRPCGEPLSEVDRPIPTPAIDAGNNVDHEVVRPIISTCCEEWKATAKDGVAESHVLVRLCVTREDGTPLANADVEVSPFWGTPVTAVTDINGTACLPFSHREAIVTIARSDFGPWLGLLIFDTREVNVVVPNGSTIVGRVVLERGSWRAVHVELTPTQHPISGTDGRMALGPPLTTTTQANGRFEFFNLPETWTGSLRFPGFTRSGVITPSRLCNYRLEPDDVPLITAVSGELLGIPIAVDTSPAPDERDRSTDIYIGPRVPNVSLGHVSPCVPWTVTLGEVELR